MSVREFLNNDLVDVKSLVHRTIDVCYSSVYCAEAVQFFKDWHHDEKILENAEKGYTIILEKSNKMVGTGSIVDNEIMRVFVDPAFQKQGFGKLIMKKLEEKALSQGIDVIKLDASIPAKKFYDDLGYITLEETFLELKDNKRLDYYKMQKSLT